MRTRLHTYALSFWNSTSTNLALTINIINIINVSLSEGTFPSSFKQSYILYPKNLLCSLSDDDFHNFRPISYFNFISKILKKVVASRIQSHLLSNSSSSSFQSAYCMSHSTSQYSSSFICSLWYCRSFHPSSSSLKLVWSSWHFSRLVSILSYLTFSGSLHPQFHFIFSQIFLVVYLKVPSLTHFFILFTQFPFTLSSPRTQPIYTTSISMTPSYRYISVTPSNSTSLLGILSNTFSWYSWMNANKSLLNPPNTEFLLVGTKQQRLKFSQLKPLSLKWQQYHPSQLFCS